MSTRKTLITLLTMALAASAFTALPAEAKKKKPKACAAYVPGEMGAEAETVKVTDLNTAEAPLEVTVTQGPGTANDQGLGEVATGEAFFDGASYAYLNVQADPKAKTTGLFVRYEFPAYEDHDLYVYTADGTQAGYVGGFNPAPNSDVGLDGTGNGGHSEEGAENLDGLPTADCGGYTLELVNFLGEGGDYTVKIWLGEAAAPAA